MDAIVTAIGAAPAADHGRFAAFNTRCFVSGKTLTDVDSKIWGVGPVCRPGIPHDVLEATAREIGRIHGEYLKQK